MTLFETIKDQDKKLGEILLEKKIIDEEQIQHVIAKSKELPSNGDQAQEYRILSLLTVHLEFGLTITRSA